MFVIAGVLLFYSCKKEPADNTNTTPNAVETKILVAGYLPSYGFSRFDMENLKYLNRVYYFALTPTSTGLFQIVGTDTVNLQLLRSKLTSKQELFVTLGGWTGSQYFHVVAKSAAKREAYAQALLQYCKQYKVDGVDLDFEDYPSTVVDSTYYAFCKDLSSVLHPEGILFTTALGVQKAAKATHVIDYVDQINVMSYGKMDGLGGHSTMDQLRTYLKDYSLQGLPNNKLIFGVPFYGKRGTITGDTSALTITYSDIVNAIHPASDINKYGAYSFNGKDLITQKTDTLMQAGYKGIMAWELSQDCSVTSEYSLLKAMYNRAIK